MKQLTALKERLSTITSFFDTRHRLIYVDYPLHTNVGDLLINLGCEQFFDDHKLHIWKRYNYYDFPRQISGITKDDIFLLHGGGNFGDIWFHFQSFRESILQRYPQNRIIFLPQSVHFRSKERLAASVRRMSAHQNLHVFARDVASLDLLQNAGLKCVSAAPDMAHSLAGVLKPTKEAAKNSKLRLMRRDQEASPCPETLSTNGIPMADWDHGTFSISRQLAHRVVVNTVKGVGRYGPPIDLHSLWYWHRDKMIRDGVDLFSVYETIITNRLHAMLLGLLLGRNVSAWDNNYGKLSSYYDSWLHDVPKLKFYRSISTEPQREALAV